MKGDYFSNTLHIFLVYTSNDQTESPAEIYKIMMPEAARTPCPDKLYGLQKSKYKIVKYIIINSPDFRKK